MKDTEQPSGTEDSPVQASHTSEIGGIASHQAEAHSLRESTTSPIIDALATTSQRSASPPFYDVTLELPIRGEAIIATDGGVRLAGGPPGEMLPPLYRENW